MHFRIRFNAKREEASCGRNQASETLIYSSGFKRTVETAEIARKLLDAGKIHLSPALRERFFGKYDGKQDAAYITIWSQDQHDEVDKQRNGVESAQEMLDRLTDLVKMLEAQYKGVRLLLVSHGDPLQVLQAAFADLEPRQREALDYINPAELRELTLGPKRPPIER